MKKVYEWLDAGNGRVLLMRFLSRFHCALITAIAYAMVMNIIQGEGVELAVYCRGLLFFVPILLSFYAAKKLPALWQFLLASLMISGISWLLTGTVAGFIAGAVLCFFRGRSRLSEEKEESAFDVPHLAVLLVFFVPFLYSAGTGQTALQKLSVFSAALYLLLFLAYSGIGRVEEYLELNRGMHGLPVRRIVRTAGIAVAALVLLAGALLLPASVLSTGSFRVDFSRLNHMGAAAQPETVMEEQPSGFEIPEELLGEEREPWFQIPPFVSYLFYALAVGGIAALILYGIYQIFKNFRSSYTDNRDVVQFLGNQEEEERLEGERRHRKISALDFSPNAAIRRRYRKTILRGSKEKPEDWAAPAELEAGAGIADETLHQLYEKARYSLEGCTPEESRALKSRGSR